MALDATWMIRENNIIITSKINTHENYLNASIENWVAEVIFLEDNASCRKAKGFKTFLREGQMKLIIWPVNNQDLNPIENLKLKFPKMLHKKTPSNKEDL